MPRTSSWDDAKLIADLWSGMLPDEAGAEQGKTRKTTQGRITALRKRGVVLPNPDVEREARRRESVERAVARIIDGASVVEAARAEGYKRNYLDMLMTHYGIKPEFVHDATAAIEAARERQASRELGRRESSRRGEGPSSRILRFTDDDIYEAIRDVARAARTDHPSIAHYTDLFHERGWKGQRPSPALIVKRMGWNNAVRAAGLTTNPRPPGFGERRVSDSELVAAYVAILARHPTRDDWLTTDEWDAYRLPGEPCAGTVRHRWGSWTEGIKAMQKIRDL